jgi:glycine hydroxymethyltransferase
MEANGSCLTNKYSEGLPGARYYGGNEFIDQVENICRERALKAFNLDPNVWGVNVQPYSGSPANFALFTGVLQPHDRIMGLDLPSGGHLTHGYQTAKKKISATSVFFESMPYQVDMKTGYIDYDTLQKNVALFRPKMIICGASAYPRDFEYDRYRKIADGACAYLMCDMAHISGLVAAGVVKSPFDVCDFVTTTTHKTLRGPRAGVIFFRKVGRDGKPTDFESKVNQAVFPGCQGGPHNNTIAGIAVAMKHAGSPEFKSYAKQVVSNARALAEALKQKGYKLVTDGTDNHIVLWDLRPVGLTGSKYERICDEVHITVNKNAVHGDVSALSPGGVRLGTSALTSRSFKETDMQQVANVLDEAVKIALKVQEKAGSKMIKDFVSALEAPEIKTELESLKKKVETFARTFPMPGFSVEGLL